MDPIEQILADAPESIRTLPPDKQRLWAERRLAILNSPAYLAKAAQEKTDEEALQAIKSDAFVQNFIAATPQQVTDYVNNNTASLAQVRALLVKMALMLLTLARREYR